MNSERRCTVPAMRGFLDYSRGFFSFFLGVAVAAACIVLLQPPAVCPFDGLTPADRQELAIMSNRTHAAAPCSKKLPMPANTTSPDDVRLLGVLRRASMEDDNTVIMTFTNKAWTAPGSLMDLFLESFRVGVRTEPLLKHLVIVAVDAKAYERCTQVHPFCYHLRVRGVDYASQQWFMSKDYLDMMWHRNRFQARVLGLGYSFVFTDMDILWLRNPLLRVPVGADLAMSADHFYGDNPYDLNKMANGGFVYAKAGARTVAFYDGWYEARQAHPGKNEQDVFDLEKHALSARHGVRVQFLDTAYLSGFCELRKDFHKVCTIHGNCIFGLKKKLRKLTKVFDEWKQFRAQAALMGSNTTALTD